VSPSLGSGRKRTATRKKTSAVERTITSGIKSAATRGVQSAAKGGRSLVTKLGAPAALTAGTISLALGVGLASFAATTAILTRIKDKRERKAQAAYEAAQAYRLARQRAEEQLGRGLTRLEHDELARAFKQQLAAIGYTP
jgi:hypothetical protein